MASPQLKEGYLRIANSLFERLYQARLSGQEIAAVLCLMRLSYGFGQKQAHMSSSFLAEQMDINEANARRLLRKLQTMNLIRCLQEARGSRPGLYELNKNWESWQIKRPAWPPLLKDSSPTRSGSSVTPKAGSLRVISDRARDSFSESSVTPVKSDMTRRKVTGDSETVHCMTGVNWGQTRASIETPATPCTEDMKDMISPSLRSGEGCGERVIGRTRPQQPTGLQRGFQLVEKIKITPSPLEIARLQKFFARPEGGDAEKLCWLQEAIEQMRSESRQHRVKWPLLRVMDLAEEAMLRAGGGTEGDEYALPEL